MRGKAPGPHAVNVFEDDCRKKKKPLRRHCLGGRKVRKRKRTRPVTTCGKWQNRGKLWARDGPRTTRSRREAKEGEENNGREVGARRELLGRGMRTRETIQHIVHRGRDTSTHHTHTHTRILDSGHTLKTQRIRLRRAIASVFFGSSSPPKKHRTRCASPGTAPPPPGSSGPS